MAALSTSLSQSDAAFRIGFVGMNVACQAGARRGVGEEAYRGVVPIQGGRPVAAVRGSELCRRRTRPLDVGAAGLEKCLRGRRQEFRGADLRGLGGGQRWQHRRDAGKRESA